jgi:hypothetical protein
VHDGEHGKDHGEDDRDRLEQAHELLCPVRDDVVVALYPALEGRWAPSDRGASSMSQGWIRQVNTVR